MHAPKGYTAHLSETNDILDPYSVLISKGALIGKGNIFYPNVVIEVTDSGKITIGDNNIFYPGTFIFSSTGSIHIGSDNTFGPAGATLRANQPDAVITIGNHGRYCDGANILGKTTLGNGTQVLGNITVQNCTLAGGGSYAETDPDKRAAVLKGMGIARDITLQQGEVVNGLGDFADAPIEWQRLYHP